MWKTRFWSQILSIVASDTRGSACERAVATAIEEQRLVLARFRLLDLTQKEGVVASVIGRVEFAFQIGEHAVQDGHAVRTRVIGNALKLVAPADRELARQPFLLFAQDVDREDFALLEMGETLGFLIHRNQQQRRVEGNR